MRTNVTIARQLGCGASNLGQSLADTLKMRCVDREILSHTAQRLACEEADIASYEESAPTFWEKLLVGLSFGPPEAVYLPETKGPLPTLEEVFRAETDVMKQLAADQDCVIVGRAAVHVLPPHPGLINIFLYAPIEFRIPRVMELYGAETPQKARALITRSDSQRQKFVQSMTGRVIDDANNYHLCLDTSALPLTEVSDLLAHFVRRRLAHVEQLSG